MGKEVDFERKCVAGFGLYYVLSMHAFIQFPI